MIIVNPKNHYTYQAVNGNRCYVSSDCGIYKYFKSILFKYNYIFITVQCSYLNGLLNCGNYDTDEMEMLLGKV